MRYRLQIKVADRWLLQATSVSRTYLTSLALRLNPVGEWRIKGARGEIVDEGNL